MINDLIARLPGTNAYSIYDLIVHQELKLCLDVGAAAGIITQRIKKVGGEGTKVIAFEPFEGNHSYFKKNTQTLKNIELITKAVASKTGISQFIVPSTVKGVEEGWEKMSGYSSAGYLIEDGTIDTFRAIYPNLQEYSMETVAIDDVVDEHVDFMKIDVQGGEFEVLRGCQRVIAEHGIDVMYVEFDGDRRILELLRSLGYTCFDTDYLIIPKVSGSQPFEEIGFYDFRPVVLSTGNHSYYAKLSLSDEEYCSFFQSFRQQKLGALFTDLICVSQTFLPTFIKNLFLYMESNGVYKGGELSSLVAPPRQMERRLNVPANRLEFPGAQPSVPVISKTQSQKGKNQSLASLQPGSNGPKNSQEKLTTLKQMGQPQAIEQKINTSAVDLSGTEKRTSTSETSNLARVITRFQKITGYYTRGPAGVAALAVALNVTAFFVDKPYQLGFAAGGTALLLFLVGHAASKANDGLTELRQLKVEQQQSILTLRRRMKQLATRQQKKIARQKKRRSLD